MKWTKCMLFWKENWIYDFLHSNLSIWNKYKHLVLRYFSEPRKLHLLFDRHRDGRDLRPGEFSDGQNQSDEWGCFTKKNTTRTFDYAPGNFIFSNLFFCYFSTKIWDVCTHSKCSFLRKYSKFAFFEKFAMILIIFFLPDSPHFHDLSTNWTNSQGEGNRKIDKRRWSIVYWVTLFYFTFSRKKMHAYH